MRFGGYIRVSRVGGRGGDAFLSPTLQRERIEGWTAAHTHELAVVREDLDVSGGRSDRDKLIGLVEDVEAGRLDGIVVATLDRFGRSLPFAIALIDRIDKAGGQFVSVADGLDTRTPYGKLALNIMLSIAQFELERIRAQWDVVMRRNIAAGKHPGAMPPFGYQRGGDGRLQTDERSVVVRDLFRRFAAGESMSALAADLNAQGVVTQNGRRVTRRFLHGILANRCYLGEARFGGLVQADAHPALVDDATFAACQEGFRQRPARTGEAAVLAGLVRCQGCRYAMAPVMRDGKRRYRCLGNQQGRKCSAPAFVTEEQLLPVVEGVFFDRVSDVAAEAAGDIERIGELRAARDVAMQALLTFRDDPEVIGTLGASGFTEGLKVRKAALDRSDAELSRALAARPDNLPDAAMLRSQWPLIDNPTRAQMFGAVFDVIVVRKHPSRSERLPIRERVRVVAKGTLGYGDVPRSSRAAAGALRPFDWPSDPGGAWIVPGEPSLEDPADR